MDRGLFEAAWNGDLNYLLKDTEADPSKHHSIALSGGETPLHIACLAGQLNFVAAVLNLRQEFARELNEDGFTPLHIASACGHVDIIKELLKVDLDFCLIKGNERRIPLHFAVIKGKVGAIKELLSASVDSIDCVTARGETSLHLAVKNSQFEAFQALVDHLERFDKEDLLNSKDDQGNTILHLAVSRKQYEVVDFLLKGQAVTKGKMEVNPLNKSNLTPLDVLLLFQSEAGDREIKEILIQHGAVKAGNLNSPTNIQEDRQDHRDASQETPRSPARMLLDYFKYNNITESPSEVRNTLLVIAILIVTATYKAVLSPPGGVLPDDYTPIPGNDTSNTNSTATAKPHTAGKSVMGTHNPIAYSIFLFANSMGFFMSLHMIGILTAAFPLRMELIILINALIWTYDTCMTAIAPSTFITFLFTGLSIAMPILIPITTFLVRNYLKMPRDLSAGRNQERV